MLVANYMIEDLKKEKNLVRILVILLIIAVGSYVYSITAQILGNFSDIIIMLIVGWLLSFVLEPLVDKTSGITKLSKFWSAVIVYTGFIVLITAIIFLFIPEVTGQINALTRVLPGYFNSYPQVINHFGDSVSNSLSNAVTLIPSVAQFFLSAFIAIIFSFYFVIDKNAINKELFSLTPKSWHEHIRFFQKVINDVFTSFLRVQLLFGIIAGVFTWLVLRMFNIDFAASTALLAGIFTTIPLVGPVLGIIPPVFVALLISPTSAIMTFVIIFIGQQILFNVIGPKLLGNAFKIHPVIIIISFFIGYKVAGWMGVIFAVPVLGILSIVLRELGHHFLKQDSSQK